MSTVVIQHEIGLIARISILLKSEFLVMEIQQLPRHYRPSVLLEHIEQLMHLAQLEQVQITQILIARPQAVF